MSDPWVQQASFLQREVEHHREERYVSRKVCLSVDEETPVSIGEHGSPM